jgi:hypothetical protein
MLANLRALLGVVIDIVLLRRGPETMPASSNLLAILVALNIGVTVLVVAVSPNPPATWPLQLIVATFVMLAIFKLAFRLANKRERFVQTASSFYAVSTLFLPAMIPLACILLPYLDKPPNPADQPPLALSLIAAGLAVWEFVVQVRIVRAAFEWHYVVAIGFIFGQNLVSGLVYMILFGVPQATA